MVYGVYIHYPICTRACYYCDFFFHANLKKIPTVEKAIIGEIRLRRDELPKEVPTSLYFGGGTPSLASIDFLEKIINYFPAEREITLEVNPEDVSPEKVRAWKSIGIQRISLGVQALDDTVLRQLNRPHSSYEVLKSLEIVSENFENFSVDFLVGIPFQTTDTLMKGVRLVVENFSPSHLSVYILTLEANTAFERFLRRGKLEKFKEEQAEREYFLVREFLLSRGYLHYEISNFALPGKEAVHNSMYWKHLPYYGFGASAHSFVPWKRFANVAGMHKYISAIERGEVPVAFKEELSRNAIFNEKIMLGLRQLSVGFSLKELLKLSEFPEVFLEKTKKFTEGGLLRESCENLLLTEAGLLLSDYISGELFE